MGALDTRTYTHTLIIIEITNKIDTFDKDTHHFIIRTHARTHARMNACSVLEWQKRCEKSIFRGSLIEYIVDNLTSKLKLN